MGREAEAIAQYNKSLSFIPRDSNTLRCRGLAFCGMGMYREALQDWEQCIPDYSVRAHMGDAYAELGEWKQAIRQRCEAMRLAETAVQVDYARYVIHYYAALMGDGDGEGKVSVSVPPVVFPADLRMWSRGHVCAWVRSFGPTCISYSWYFGGVDGAMLREMDDVELLKNGVWDHKYRVRMLDALDRIRGPDRSKGVGEGVKSSKSPKSP